MMKVDSFAPILDLFVLINLAAILDIPRRQHERIAKRMILSNLLFSLNPLRD